MTERELTEFSVELYQVQFLHQPGLNGLTLIQVLRGELLFGAGEQTSTLSSGAIQLVNRHTDWSLHSQSENMVMIVTLSGQWVARWYPDFFLYDYQLTDSNAPRNWNHALHTALRQVLEATVMKNAQRYRLELNRWLSEVMLVLITGFQQPTKANGSRHQHWSRRITQVVQRIENNVERRISLGEIARAEFVSEAWLSRLFRREVGVSFMQFITTLRLQNAVEALRTTSKPVHQIALEQGFANNRQMIDLFKRHYGKTPRQFRRNPQEDAAERPQVRENEPRDVTPVPSHLIFALLNQAEPHKDASSAPHYDTGEELKVTLHHGRMRPQRIRDIVITVRDIDDLLQHEVQAQLRELHATLPLSGLDIAEPLLNSPLLRTDWHTPLMANPGWMRLQQILHFIDELDVALNLRLDADSTPQQLGHFLRQCVDYFPLSRLSRWRFLWVWSADTPARNNEQSWKTLRWCIRQHLPQAQIGLYYPFAPGTDGIRHEPVWHQPWLREADFIACTADANETLDLHSALDEDAPLQRAVDYPTQRLQAITAELHRHKLTLPVHLLAWNTLTGQTLYANGGFFRGALLMHTLLSLPDSVVNVGFWLNATLQHEALENEKFDTSSLAIWFGDALPRPVYWVLRLWSRLRGERAASGHGHLLTRSDDGWQLLLSNTVAFNPDLSSQETFIQRFRRRMSLTINSIPPGRWRIRRLRFDQQNGALFPLMEHMQSVSGPDAEALDWIRHRARPQMQMWEETLSGEWRVQETLESNALVLYELSPLR